MIIKRRMFLAWENGTKYFEFPLLPEKLEMEYPSHSASVNIDGLGEVGIYKDSKLTRVSFSSCFPASAVPGLHERIPGIPSNNILLFEKWMRDNTVLQFMVSGWGWNLNISCTVESFKFYEQGGDVDSIYYTLSLATYREPCIRQVTVNAAGEVIVDDGLTRVDTRPVLKTYKAEDFEDLYSIAKMQLNNEGRWKEIYILNADILCGNFHAAPGMVLQMPER